MDYLATLNACKKAIDREGFRYFKLLPKKLVSVHYNQEIVEGDSVAVTFHSLECMQTLTVETLYSANKGLGLFNKIGVLKGLSTVEIPRNLMVPEIQAETLVLLVEQSYVPANELRFDPTYCQNKNTVEETISADWERYGDSFEFYIRKLGVDPQLLKSCQGRLIQLEIV